MVFAIRTRLVPFLGSRSSRPLLLAVLAVVAVVAIGAILPETPLSDPLGFQSLPGGFFLALVLMVACYLALIEAGKRWFYRVAAVPPVSRPRSRVHGLHRRAARFSTADRMPSQQPRDQTG